MKLNKAILILTCLIIFSLVNSSLRRKLSHKSSHKHKTKGCSLDYFRIYINENYSQSEYIKNFYGPTGKYARGLFFNTGNIQGDSSKVFFKKDNEMFIPYRNFGNFCWDENCWTCRRTFTSTVKADTMLYNIRFELDLNCWTNDGQIGWVNTINNYIKNNKSDVKNARKTAIDEASAYIENTNSITAISGGKATIDSKITSLNADIASITNSMTTNEQSRKTTQALLDAEIIKGQQLKNEKDKLESDDRDANQELESKKEIKTQIDSNLSNTAGQATKYKADSEDNLSEFKTNLALLREKAVGNGAKEQIDLVEKYFNEQNPDKVQETLRLIIA